jgi:hypothetical protein
LDPWTPITLVVPCKKCVSTDPEFSRYGNEKEIHVILDNLNTHKPKNDRWLKSRPNVHFHSTPTHTSWLNQIQCWFSVLSRQTLKGASFVDVKQLREAIDHCGMRPPAPGQSRRAKK